MTDPRDDPHSLYNRGAADQGLLPGTGIDILHAPTIDIAACTDAQLAEVASFDAQAALLEARRRERARVLSRIESLASRMSDGTRVCEWEDVEREIAKLRSEP